MGGGWVYIVANRPHGMIYAGVSAYLAKRIKQHREGRGSAYCRRYGIKILVYAEWHDSIYDAIVREKRLKTWKREWKDLLIEEGNPQWRDLYDTLV